MPANSLSSRVLIAILLTVFLGMPSAVAQVPVPGLAQRVTDLTATLSAEQQATLEQRLAAFEQQKGSQIAVLIVPTTQPEDVAQYSIRVAEQWKLGRKGVDDGVLLLVAKDDRTMRIEVGYGLEGAIPDAIAKRIIAEIITPHFRDGDFAGGINAGVDSLIGLIQGEPLPEPKTNGPGSRPEHYLPVLFLVALAGGGILRAMLGEFLGGMINGGMVGVLVWLLGGGLIYALGLAFMAFLITLGNGRGFRGGIGGGFGGGDGFGGGGFSGGGGGFGGGGASGRW